MLASVCVAGVVAIVSLGAYLTVSDNLYQQLDENLQVRADAAAHALPVQVRLERIPGAFLSSSDLQIGLLSANGQMVAPDEGSAPPVTTLELQVATGAVQGPTLRTDARGDVRVVAVSSGNGQAMVLAQSLAPTKKTLKELAVVLFLIGGAGIVVAGLVGMVVARGGLRPVERLTSATERVTRTGDLRPIPISGDDELARLTQSFNAMLGAVADSQERQRQLVADAGHELRTPLTSLRTNLELLLSAERAGAPKLSERDRAEIESDIKAQLDELTQLIGDLVELARQDEPRTQFERVELIDVVERALDRARRRAGEIDFEVSLQPWVVTGDNSALERAVLNLLDNAVKFSPDGSLVKVRMYPLGDGTAVIEVADSGPGIADADLGKVFDRFYRSSEARTLPGSGLGLAIVKHAAERHGGTVYAGRAPEGGALMTIRLPGSAA
ncbi:HAMP domain-containing sensor histidine kinase [Amycolatopsis sp. CA-230715]|uniref:HAMP domain-containing sensor histidine kinase n=1 Tax=Amycolatopsis sp. CA-230715 TaxID=2745196 RepID=UPI001C011DD3|nr:HAMP domain-containing sensor histidine kinase [Amycolatopsis sp. CA-230715]QWF81879.1 Signal transduction histidine-protein kinase/phosphatase MprB [Amycolatopsis sp. CA-230715]